MSCRPVINDFTRRKSVNKYVTPVPRRDDKLSNSQQDKNKITALAGGYLKGAIGSSPAIAKFLVLV